jgi:hypothetical protein
MAQISRPFQIAFVGVVLLAGVWLFALHGHTSNSNEPSAATTASTSTPATSVQHTATDAGHRTAARRAASTAVPKRTSSAEDKHTSSAAVSHAARSRTAASSTQPRVSAETAHTTPNAAKHAVTHTTDAASAGAKGATSATHVTVTQPVKSHAGAGRTPATQALVEGALKQGKVAVILFWNPKGVEDNVVNAELSLLEAVHHLIHPIAHVPQVRRELEQSGLELQKSFAGFRATAGQVASFGTITRDLQVATTPTLFIINKDGKAMVLTGVQDAFTIEQAIDEVRNS